MENIDIKQLAAKLVDDLKDLKAEAAQVKGIKDALAVLPDVIKKVEQVSGGVKMAGGQKKELAVSIINALVDIPWVPEAAEAALISLAIDAVIAGFNKVFGKNWLAKAE